MFVLLDIAAIALMVERPLCKRRVLGSNPSRGSTFVLLYIYSESSYDG